MTTKFRCNGFRDITDAPLNEAIEVFAKRAARREYGRHGAATSTYIVGYYANDRLAIVQTYIGRRMSGGVGCGRNLQLEVYYGVEA